MALEQTKQPQRVAFGSGAFCDPAQRLALAAKLDEQATLQAFTIFNERVIFDGTVSHVRLQNFVRCARGIG